MIASLLWLVRSLYVKKQQSKRRVEEIKRLSPRTADILEDLKPFFAFNHYITESERVALVEKYKDEVAALKLIYGSKELETSEQKDEINRLYKALVSSSECKKTNNEQFIKLQLSNHKDFFDTVLSHPLDNQQREAIVSLEDNVLVISSAGSGKTMTTVGKVKYLTNIMGVDPSKILLITFTRKAAESLSERLGDPKLKCVTFHKLALDIISQANKVKPTISPSSTAIQVYQNLMKGNARFLVAISSYILRSRYKMKDQFEYNSLQEYIQDRKKYGIKSYYTDKQGHSVYCKSDEESQIADYLGSIGVKFMYEESYQVATADIDHRQYQPDFSIYYKDSAGEERRIYLEHFAVNKDLRCPRWFGPGEEENYLKGIVWKRNLHKQYKTTLIETRSADFHDGTVFEKLLQQLTRLGVPILENKGLSDRELERQEQSIVDMLTAFNFLMKAKGQNKDSFGPLSMAFQDRITFNTLVYPFLQEYDRIEMERKEIDFTDAIIQATNLCNNGHRPDYEYILVDEFQDISIDRYRFLQSLRCARPLTKLFCVGDDWQSIYRFAGSDVSLFKDFDKYFGYTKECRMETTYRFGDPLIAKSSKFILTNPDQKHKNVRSFKSTVVTGLEFKATDGRESVAPILESIISSIPADKEIYLLGRYSFDVNILKNSRFVIQEQRDEVFVQYGSRRMRFLTIHKSKGLECDYAVILNCNSGIIGFPAEISDSPILKYVLSSPDGYEYGEERRVFYVGITRARVKTYVLYESSHPSPFVVEFIDSLQKKPENIPASELCPLCRSGRVRVMKEGIARNGHPYKFVVCSNENIGCRYKTTIFYNSVTMRKQRRR